ncbi:MAG: pectate lyase-like adhesive domain-containing protein [Lachnospiraceae bacterium]
MQFQMSAEEIATDNNGNQYIDTEEETQFQPSIEETEINIIEETEIEPSDEETEHDIIEETEIEPSDEETEHDIVDETEIEPSDEETEHDIVDETEIEPSDEETDIDETDEEYIIDEILLMVGLYSEILDTNEIIVENEAEFRAALANAQYTKIYLGVDITMSSSSYNNIVVARTEPLVINGTDPREGGARHTYTDYNGSDTGQALGGACTDITFKDIDLNLRNHFGIYFATNTNGTNVTLDNVTGSAIQVFFGRGYNSTLVIKDSELTLSNTGRGNPQEFVENAGAVNFVGTVEVTKSASTGDYFFNMTSNATVNIEEGANVVLDNSISTSGTFFSNVTDFTVGAGATFACYIGGQFTRTSLINVTIGENADVRFIHTGRSNVTSSLYGIDSASTFTAEAGSKFLLYGNRTDSVWGAFLFVNITLNNVDSFVVLNASGRAIGNWSNTKDLIANGVSSIRYYPSGQISDLFDTGTYEYTPGRSPDKWWANTSPFSVTAAGWAHAASLTFTNNTYSSANVPSSTITVQTTLESSNFRLNGTAAYGVEIYGGTISICTVTYDGNGANSGTVPAGDAGVPDDPIIIEDNTGSLARTGYTFDGWNTAADGTGTTYRTGDTFIITEDTILYAKWVPDKYTVSGTLSGVDTVSGLSVSYTTEDGETHTVTTDYNGGYTITDVPHGSDVIITPPAQTGYVVTPARITVSDVSTNSSGNDFVYTLATYTVTEKYLDELTGSGFGQNDTYAAGTTSPYNYSYDGSLEDITVDGDTYTYMGYKAGDYSPGDVLDGSGAPEASGLTADTAVYLIYHKITNTIDVTFPTGSSWEFYVNQDTYPYVETGSMGSSNKYYEFKNNSDKPVYVDLTEVQVNASGGLSLVADASLSTLGSSEYSLNLSTASSSVLPSELTNGFSTNTVTGITEGIFGAGTKQLGSLDGQYITQSTPTAANGYITIGGYYAGHLSADPKSPQLMFNFTFSLIP